MNSDTSTREPGSWYWPLDNYSSGIPPLHQLATSAIPVPSQQE